MGGSGEGGTTCIFCGEEFEDECEFNSHLLLHVNENPSANDAATSTASSHLNDHVHLGFQECPELADPGEGRGRKRPALTTNQRINLLSDLMSKDLRVSLVKLENTPLAKKKKKYGGILGDILEKPSGGVGGDGEVVQVYVAQTDGDKKDDEERQASPPEEQRSPLPVAPKEEKPPRRSPVKKPLAFNQNKLLSLWQGLSRVSTKKKEEDKTKEPTQQEKLKTEEKNGDKVAELEPEVETSDNSPPEVVVTETDQPVELIPTPSEPVNAEPEVTVVDCESSSVLPTESPPESMVSSEATDKDAFIVEDKEGPESEIISISFCDEDEIKARLVSQPSNPENLSSSVTTEKTVVQDIPSNAITPEALPSPAAVTPTVTPALTQPTSTKSVPDADPARIVPATKEEGTQIIAEEKIYEVIEIISSSGGCEEEDENKTPVSQPLGEETPVEKPVEQGNVEPESVNVMDCEPPPNLADSSEANDDSASIVQEETDLHIDIISTNPCEDLRMPPPGSEPTSPGPELSPGRSVNDIPSNANTPRAGPSNAASTPKVTPASKPPSPLKEVTLPNPPASSSSSLMPPPAAVPALRKSSRQRQQPHKPNKRSVVSSAPPQKAPLPPVPSKISVEIVAFNESDETIEPVCSPNARLLFHTPHPIMENRVSHPKNLFFEVDGIVKMPLLSVKSLRLMGRNKGICSGPASSSSPSSSSEDDDESEPPTSQRTRVYKRSAPSSTPDRRGHHLTNIKDRPYECSDCGKRYKAACHLATHMKHKHNTKPAASKGSSTIPKAKVTVKVKRQRQQKQKPATATTARVVKPGSSKSKRPSSSEPKPEGQKYRCEYCGIHLPTEQGLKMHLRFHSKVYKNDGKRTHLCQICTKRFHGKSTLVRHIIGMHMRETKPKSDAVRCPFCNQLGNNKLPFQGLYTHVSAHLTKPPPGDEIKKGSLGNGRFKESWAEVENKPN